MRAVAPARRLDQVLASQQQARILRPAHALAAGKGHQVETHPGVIPQIGNRRYIGGGIVETGHAVAMGHLDPFFAPDLALFRRIVEVAHHRAVGERRLILRQTLHLDKADAAIADGMVVAIAVRLLNDDLILQPRHRQRQQAHRRAVSHRHTGGRAQGERRSGTGANQRRLALQAPGNILAGLLLQLRQPHRMFGGAGHRGLHHWRHDRRGQRRIGAGGIDDLGDAKLVVIVLAMHIRRGMGGRRARDTGGGQGALRPGEKTAAGCGTDHTSLSTSCLADED